MNVVGDNVVVELNCPKAEKTNVIAEFGQAPLLPQARMIYKPDLDAVNEKPPDVYADRAGVAAMVKPV